MQTPKANEDEEARTTVPKGLVLIFGLLGMLIFQTYHMNNLPSFRIALPSLSPSSSFGPVGRINSDSSRLVTSRRKDTTRTKIPLDELTRPSRDIECPVPTGRVNNKVLRDSSRWNKLIPNIVHQTSKSRCLHMGFHRVLGSWKNFTELEYYFHDDDAIWRLINQPWPEFPHLQRVLKCVKSMTAVADVWRYLVLWEYGGIYADIDSLPNSWTPADLRQDDDAYMIVEFYFTPSQYFMAFSPRHPMIYYTIIHCLNNIMNLEDPSKLDPSRDTGPITLRSGYVYFMLDVGLIKGKPVSNGTFVGRYNRSVRLDGYGGPDASDFIIRREAMPRSVKIKMYHEMNMTHFFEDRAKGNNETDLPCSSQWYDMTVGPPAEFVVDEMRR